MERKRKKCRECGGIKTKQIKRKQKCKESGSRDDKENKKKKRKNRNERV